MFKTMVIIIQLTWQICMNFLVTNPAETRPWSTMVDHGQA